MSQDKYAEILKKMKKASDSFSSISDRETKDLFRKEVMENIFLENMGYQNKIPKQDLQKDEIIVSNILIKSMSEDNIKKEDMIFAKAPDTIDWEIVIAPTGLWLLCKKDIKESETDIFRTGHIVLEIIYSKYTDQKYFRYFSYENLTGPTASAFFFRDILKYKNEVYNGAKKSWYVYSSALKRSLDFYIQEKVLCYSESPQDAYQDIKLTWFNEFILKCTQITSENAVKNAFFHQKDFMFHMMKNKAFDVKTEDVIALFNNMRPKGERIVIDIEKMRKIYSFFNKKKSKRNVVLFCFILAFGIERRKLCELRWKENIDLDSNLIFLDGRKFKMPSVIEKLLAEYKEQQGGNGYLFSNKSDEDIPIKEGLVNDIFSRLTKIDEEDSYYKRITPGAIRNALPYYFLQQNVPLQFIINRMGIQLYNLGNYLEQEEIYCISMHMQGKNMKNIDDVIEKMLYKIVKK